MAPFLMLGMKRFHTYSMSLANHIISMYVLVYCLLNSEEHAITISFYHFIYLKCSFEGVEEYLSFINVLIPV